MYGYKFSVNNIQCNNQYGINIRTLSNIIATLLSSANAKYLMKYILQNIFSLIGLYISKKYLQLCLRILLDQLVNSVMNNIYGQKCSSHMILTGIKIKSICAQHTQAHAASAPQDSAEDLMVISGFPPVVTPLLVL